MRDLRARLGRARAALRAPAAPAPSEGLLQAPWIARLAAEGPAPLTGAPPGDGPLDVALVVPAFRRGSGGHTTIANLVRGLEARGHRCSIWLHDPAGAAGGAQAFRAFFGPFAAPVHDDLTAFEGAGIVLATGWQTVAPVLLLAGCGARAYLVQDLETEFHPASVERVWAQASYGHGLACVTAGPWLAERMRDLGAPVATPFDLGIDLAAYTAEPARQRRRDRVVFYARAVTPRRAVPLGLLALEELRRRRPGVEVVTFGDPDPPPAPFPVTHLGVAGAPQLAAAYREASAGLVLSLTNHSLVAQEMLACGLPAVELDTPATRAAFARAGAPVELAPADPGALAGALERALDAPAGRASEAVAWARERTWARAAEQVEAGLRAALAAR